MCVPRSPNGVQGSVACVDELTRVLEDAAQRGLKPKYFDSVESLVGGQWVVGGCWLAVVGWRLADCVHT